jgi:pimeloyl-ACP methyl ester carboxylesterase
MQPRSCNLYCLSPEGFHRIRYWEWGLEDSARTVICVHGLTRNGRDFDDLAQFLAGRGWRVVCPDIVGRGESDWLQHKENYDFSTYVNDMSQLIARLGGAPVHWVGTSMGGIIGQLIAAKDQAPIKRMVLNDIGPLIDAQGLSRIKGYVGNDPSFPNFEAAEEAINKVTDKFGPMNKTQRKRFVEVSIRKRSNGAFTTNYDPRIAWAFKENDPEDVDMWSLWPLIKCPILVIRGVDSDLLSASTSHRMQTEGPKAEEYVLEGVGHAPTLMSSEEINRITLFLEAENNQ